LETANGIVNVPFKQVGLQCLYSCRQRLRTFVGLTPYDSGQGEKRARIGLSRFQGVCALAKKFPAQLLYRMPIKQTLSRTERNRRAMNGMPMDAPRSLIKKSSERHPMIDLEAADEAAELEHARKAQLEEKERSRAAHQAAEASAPAPVKAKPAKREKR
jgi:hypothetical protein